MSHESTSQGQAVALPLRITQEIDDQLAELASRWAATMTVKARIGKATIAREAMLRGMKLIDRELTIMENLKAQQAGEPSGDGE